MRSVLARNARSLARPFALPATLRRIQISATPTASSLASEQLPVNELAVDEGSPDAQFEIIGAPYSLLSASLSASQTLYTRRGTLVGVSGKAENAVSTLSILEPFRRMFLGIPFFYQKITSATPITALISSKSPITSFVVVQLDGTTDWMVTQRKALLAWTGQTLGITPTMNTRMSLAYWGNSEISGRGLVALAGQGQIYQIRLKSGEEYVAHPSNVVAYTMGKNPPAPYRFKSSVLRLEVPGLSGLGRFLPETRFFRVMRETGTWKAITGILFTLRTWSRRTIWGDRLFLRFHGPTTLLLQSRAARISDVLTSRDINEIADVEPGQISSPATLRREEPDKATASTTTGSVPMPAAIKGPSMSYASVSRTGEVRFEALAETSSKPAT